MISSVAAYSDSGYTPCSIGPWKTPLARSSIFRAAARSAGSCEKGLTTEELRLTATELRAGIAARRAVAPRPCARLRWCAALREAAASVRPGACTPEP